MTMYSEKELVGIAKRENNTMRKYLVVNRLQGKHVPANPGEVFRLFRALADELERVYRNERLLLIGFAETATAIGAECAVQLGTYFLQTTREKIEGAEYLYFSEIHSHAAEQKLVKNGLNEVINQTDRIVFVEDEVTTGNTILNIIDVLEREYACGLRFSAASLLNGMCQKAEERFAERGIRLHYLVKTNHEGYTGIAEKYRADGTYYGRNTVENAAEIQILKADGYRNARTVLEGKVYLQACEKLWEQIHKRVEIDAGEKILVLGTEEFMYPALFVAWKLEELGNCVKCHSTTRSPIAVSTETTYPLHKRYELASLYDRERKTFLYDLEKYDRVFIITDADCREREGVDSLVNAVFSCGNHNIYLVRWC